MTPTHSAAFARLAAISTLMTLGTFPWQTIEAQEPTRKISFTTTEGTWTSLDVSPDGQTIVFDLLGDLYTLPIEGGRASRVTSGRPFDLAPRWSPDGQWIAFTSDREGNSDLWRVRPDGSDLRLVARTDGKFGTPVWEANGEYLIVADGAFKRFPVGGGPGRPVHDSTDANRASGLGPFTSRDGKYLYYSFGGGFGAETGGQIARLNLATRRVETLRRARGGAMRPTVSPDGKTLAFGTRLDDRTGIRLRDLTTDAERWLIYPVDRDGSQAFFSSLDIMPGYSFTPDGKSLIIAINNKIHRVEVATGRDDIIPMTVDVALELGPRLLYPHRIDTGVVRAQLISGATLGPDGKTLIYTAFERIYLQTLPDGQPRLLLPDSIRAADPAWSRDGAWIAYVTFDPARGAKLWKIRSTGGEPQLVASGAHPYNAPVWSPDGARIYVVRRSALDPWTRQSSEWSSDVVSAPSGGGDVTVIPGATGRVHFSADGRLLFSTDRGISTATPTGDSVRLVSRLTSWEGLRIHPDGRHILMPERHRLLLVRLPEQSDTTPVDLGSPKVTTATISWTGVDQMEWANNGETITWTVGSTFFQLPLASLNLPDQGGRVAVTVEPTATEIVIQRPRHRPLGSVMLQNARILSMAGDRIERGDLLVIGDRIAAVGPAGTITAPLGTRLIDAAGTTILPGFVDLHPHWEGLDLRAADRNPWSVAAALAYGVTSGRVPGGGGGNPGIYTFADRQAIGDLLAPRIWASEPNFGGGLITAQDSQPEADSLISMYRRYYRTDFLKQYMAGPRKVRQMIAAAAAKYRLVATTEGGFDLLLHLTNMMDGFATEHTYPITPIGDDMLQLIALSGTPYDPTLSINQGSQSSVTGQDYFYWNTPVHDDPKLRRFIPHSVLDAKTAARKWYDPVWDPTVSFAKDVMRVARSGGLVVVGSHSEMEGLSFHWEMWTYARGGMTPTEILRAATINGAKALGYDRDLGSIEVGKLADLVILNANPLDDIRNTGAIRWVMRGGVLYDASTLDEIWPTAKTRGPAWWRALEPSPEAEIYR